MYSIIRSAILLTTLEKLRFQVTVLQNDLCARFMVLPNETANPMLRNSIALGRHQLFFVFSTNYLR